LRAETLPGYDPDVAKNRAQARGIMEKLGYGPDNRLAVKVSNGMAVRRSTGLAPP